MDTVLVKSKMQKVIEAMLGEVASIRTGRATSALVEDIMVPAYGGQSRMRVMELASITTPDTQTIVISPWDKSIIGDIKKGLLEANVGMNPSIDGEVLRIVFPPLTTEDRERYVKLLHTKLENAKVAIRQIRGDEMKIIKEQFEEKEIGEDMKFGLEDDLQKITDEYVGKIEDIGKRKEQDLLQV
jgi:ribosome recycling factor